MATAKKKTESVQDQAETGTALIALDTLKAVEIFVPSGTQHMIEILEKEVAVFVPDVSTDEGRKAISRFNLKIASSKTGVSAMATELTEGWRKKTGEVNAERKRFVDRCEELQEQVSAPLSKWKAAEKKRVDDLNEKLEQLKEFGNLPHEPSSDNIRQRLIDAEEMRDTTNWEDFAELAQEALGLITSSLNLALGTAINREAQAEELRQLREEKAFAVRQKEIDDAAAQATKDAEAVAAKTLQDERDRVVRAEEQTKQAKANEEQAKLDTAKAIADSAAAVQKAADDAAAAERAKQKKIQDDRDAEEARLAADKAHRGKINSLALAAMKLAAPTIIDEQGIAILTAIVNGKVPQVKITYTV